MNAKLRMVLAVWSLLAGVVAMPLAAVADTLVTPRSETEVKRIAVKLSDVFDGVPAEIDREIAQAPEPCKKIVYDVNVLTRLAQKYRLDWTAQSLADHVMISSACTRITSDMMRDAVVQKMKDTGTHGDIDVLLDNRALEIDLPADQTPYFTLNDFSYDAASKRFRTEIVANGSSGITNVPVAGRITVKQRVPVLAHRLEAGTTLGSNDIDWVKVAEDRINASVVQDADRLVGRELRHDVNGGELLHSGDVVPVRHVTRGSLVTLKIETPFMLVTAQGKAMQDGTDGDVVRVTNMQSNRVVEGVVDGAGIVRIQVAQHVAMAE